MNWWSANRLRLIQNNLRETDAVMNVDLLIQELQSYQANVLMMNVGGIFAFYPSLLQHQYVTPYLKKDLVGEVLEKTHEAGLKFIARFDFSKVHESLFASHPDWFYRDREGREVNYSGIVHTCLNGEYQQEKSLESIGEVLERYEVDGIFFNMFGYQHWDYSGNYYGPCYCENCRRRFKELTGEDLSDYAGSGHPLHAAYRTFQEQTSRRMLEKIHAFVKSKRPDVAISTYHSHQVDIVRKESNTSLTRRGPLWLYSASENVATIANSWEGKLISNCSINAVDLTYRFTGVSEEETAIRLYQNIANGSGLDFCIIGAFEGYPDQANLPTVKEIFHFHARNEDIFGNLYSMAEVVLVKPLDSGAGEEYFGLFKMLKESHIVFDVVLEEQLAAMAGQLKLARAVLLPGLQRPRADAVRALRAAQQAGAVLLATGIALERDADLLSEWFGATSGQLRLNEPAAYLDVTDVRHFPSMKGRGWIISGEFARFTFHPEVECRMTYIEASTFGPPERAYGHRISTHSALGILRRGGRAIGGYFPWSPGALYYRHGFEDHKRVVTDTLLELMGRRRLTTNAPASTEIFLHQMKDGNYLLQLLNLSGFNGTTYMKPIPLNELQIELEIPSPLMQARSLCTRENLHLDSCGDLVRISLPRLDRYEALVLEVPKTSQQRRKEGLPNEARNDLAQVEDDV